MHNTMYIKLIKCRYFFLNQYMHVQTNSYKIMTVLHVLSSKVHLIHSLSICLGRDSEYTVKFYGLQFTH